jgi:hypothetical protein
MDEIQSEDNVARRDIRWLLRRRGSGKIATLERILDTLFANIHYYFTNVRGSSQLIRNCSLTNVHELFAY